MATYPLPQLTRANRALAEALAEVIQQAVTQAVETVLAELPAPGQSAAEQQLYSQREAAQKLGMSVRTVNRMVQSGALERVTVGRAVRVPSSSIEAYLARLAGQTKRAVRTSSPVRLTRSRVATKRPA